MHDVVLVKKAQALQIVAIAIRQYRVPGPVWITKSRGVCRGCESIPARAFAKHGGESLFLFHSPRAPG